MKTTLAFLIATLAVGCGTSVKFLAFDPALQAGSALNRVALLTLDGAAYPMHHNIYAVQNIGFHQATTDALENAVKKYRKAWQIVYPAAINAAADTVFRNRMAQIKDNCDSVPADVKEAMKKLAGLLETKYFLLLESIALKDVSNPQVPSALVTGVCIQLWDFEQGKVVYRARSTSRTIDYSDKEMKKKLKSALFDLACDLIAPLPKK